MATLNENNDQYRWDSADISNSINSAQKKKRHIPKTNEVLMLASRFASMLSSGLSTVDVLECIEEEAQETGNKKMSLDAVVWKSEVVRGKPLASAIDKGETQFPDAFLSVLKAGESTGKLAESISVYVSEVRRMDSAERKMRASVTYPSIVIGISLVLLVLLCVFALPRLETMFSSVGVPPKGISAIIFTAGKTIGFFGPLPPLLFAVIFDIWLFSPMGKKKFIDFLSFIPAMRRIKEASEWSSFCSSMGIALHAGLGVVNSLESVRDAAPSAIKGSSYDRLLNGIVSGKSILDVQGIKIPSAVRSYLRAAEKTGEMKDAFSKAAEYYASELDEKLAAFSQTVEPTLTLVVLGFVGIVPVGIIKAMTDMYTTVLSQVVK